MVHVQPCLFTYTIPPSPQVWFFYITLHPPSGLQASSFRSIYIQNYFCCAPFKKTGLKPGIFKIVWLRGPHCPRRFPTVACARSHSSPQNHASAWWARYGSEFEWCAEFFKLYVDVVYKV
ncbi:hypothetical protein LENED_006966 [Lentinula edodes]|uniref:Uncharacterized protein n=1 Tax=Lentinula edodes TaxID=5353 RepID=A0A1Q3ED46_LENED|nr:hypothetical protein LENED_006966 [Lentinula edodes]